MSDRVAPNYYPDLETRMIDVLAVMDAAGSERAVIFGLSEGGPMAMLFAATYPERTVALIAYGATPRYAWAPDFPWGTPTNSLRSGSPMIVLGGAPTEWAIDGLRSWAAPSLAGDEREIAFIATTVRQGASPGAGETLARMNHEIDVRAILPTIRVPALEIARQGDPIPPPDGYTAKLIPGCRHVELPGEDHLPWAGDVEALVASLEDFIGSVQDEEAEMSRVLCTVLFTDIVDSTAQAAGMGDRRWREVVDEHDRIVRGQIARYQGREIKTMGDGFLATFDGPARAIRAATSSVEAVSRLGIEIRAGLHTGECRDPRRRRRRARRGDRSESRRESQRIGGDRLSNRKRHRGWVRTHLSRRRQTRAEGRPRQLAAFSSGDLT